MIIFDIQEDVILVSAIASRQMTITRWVEAISETAIYKRDASNPERNYSIADNRDSSFIYEVK